MRALMDDMDRLMSVMDKAFDPLFREAWTRRQVEDALSIGNCRYFLISENGKPMLPNGEYSGETACGFYLSRQILTETELLLLAVNPDFRRRGLGEILLQDLVNTAARNGCDRVFLEMRRYNPAEFLYRRFGFVPVGERRNYYRTRDGQMLDAITFSMSI